LVCKDKIKSFSASEDGKTLKSTQDLTYDDLKDRLVLELFENTNKLVKLYEKDEDRRNAAFKDTLEILKIMWKVLKDTKDDKGFLAWKTNEYLNKASTDGGQEMSSAVKEFREKFAFIFSINKNNKEIVPVRSLQS